jgi:hypothetical protein
LLDLWINPGRVELTAEKVPLEVAVLEESAAAMLYLYVPISVGVNRHNQWRGPVGFHELLLEVVYCWKGKHGITLAIPEGATKLPLTSITPLSYGLL